MKKKSKYNILKFKKNTKNFIILLIDEIYELGEMI